MIKSEEISNPESCLNRAADDEPVFVLRANDLSAPTIVRLWAQDYAFEKGGVGKMTPKQLIKFNESIDVANKMENWHRIKKRS